MKKKRNKSPSELSEKEIIECILAYSCKQDIDLEELLSTVVERASSLRSFLTLPENVVKEMNIPNVERCLEYMSMLREYAIRVATPYPKTLFSEESSIRFAHMMLMRIGHYRTEVILGILFNKQKRFLCIENVALGSVNTAVFDTQTVVEALNRHKASYVILVHNHPSGACFPSQEDENATQLIARGCEACGHEVLDHYIVTASEVYSMYTESYLIETTL